MVTTPVSQGDRGWVAAALEIKGKAHRTPRAGGYPPQIKLRVNSSEDGLIARLCQLTGVGKQFNSAENIFDRKQCQSHCPEPHVHVKVPPGGFRWELSGVALGVVLDGCKPFFSYRNLEFEHLAAEIWSARVGRGSGAALGALDRLARLGWDTTVAQLEMAQ